MRELPAGWSFWGEEAGATTTLLVERLAERGGTLSPIEATLLLLGIYEDTGALSYSTTTPRDMRAAAWLLERGANLLVVNRFLHHPLTDEQQQLYEQLADSAQPYQFHGHTVIIASASVRTPVEEISTLAHKLYDLYEPDGLFILVEMGNYLQMVARSTNDAIDVGNIAAAFGGGGHSRAAAALVRESSLPSVFESLVYALQSHIRPSITVSQIMSYGTPQTLAPTDTIATAAERGRRYGFEGFPVVEGSRIVGMLTRREIDRAIHHGLEGHSVRRYMRAGEIYVTPEDSVATLRKVMSDHDWGQVPVLDPQTGALLGIVTRTDLIRQGATVSVGPESLADTMARALPAALLDLLHQVGAVAGDLGYPLYVVGGFVRDLLLGQPNFDVDLVVEGDAIRLAQLLAQRAGGRVRSHRRFGTAKWILPVAGKQAASEQPDGILPESLDFVTARTEFYEHPTALPTVERSSIKQDLHRRDFTINTLAIRLTPDRWGELLDAYGGRRDLDEGIIRVLHSLSFIEDPRASCALASSNSASSSHRAAHRGTHRRRPGPAGRVSAERIRHELELILAEAQPERSLCRLAELGVLVRLHPALHCDAWFIAEISGLRAEWHTLLSDSACADNLAAEELPWLYFALLTYGMEDADLVELNEKVRIRKEYRDLTQEVHRLAACLPQLAAPDLRPSEAVKLLDESSAGARLVLHIAADDEAVRRNLERYEREWQHVHPLLTGDDLRKLGLPPGRIYRAVLDRIRSARLDGAIATRGEEEALARQAIQAART